MRSLLLEKGVVRPIFIALMMLLVPQRLLAMDVFFESRSIQEVLPWLASKMQESLVISPDIDDQLTLSIKDASWREVMQAVAQNPSIDLTWQGAVAVLMPALKKEEKANCQRAYWMLRHAKAKAVGGHLSVLYPTISLIVDERTNSLITYYCQPVEGLAQTLAWLDVPLRQIEISAQIAQVSTSAQSQFGANWQANLSNSVRSSIGGAIDLGALAATSRLSVSGSSGLNLLSFTLDMLESEGMAKVLSKPKIVAVEGQLARIESGTEIPYQTVDDDTVNVEFRDAALLLEVRPFVKEGKRILLELTIHQDSVGELVNGVPSLETNRLKTHVVVNDQETLVLGGIFREERFKTTSKVPVLGDIPILGIFFKRQTEQQEKVELLVFITPKLLQMSVN
ncbi:MAG: type II and III secretion system protein [Marinomonas sp.]|jgi:protein transport protein HofQ/type IV pilus assembly protein PilQ|uniref:type II and III secretion system protein n=1 Tax=Marinomonas sp. TaxID=1904862 RepID=UPI003C7320DA